MMSYLRALGRSSAMESPSSAADGSRLASESSAPGGNWLLGSPLLPAAPPCTLRSSSLCAAAAAFPLQMKSGSNTTLGRKKGAGPACKQMVLLHARIAPSLALSEAALLLH